MSEPVAKERPIVDLDEFERRLRQRDHDQEDPLAELARLVGETSDPYGDVFAQEAMAYPAAAPPQPAAPRVTAEREPTPVSPRLSGDFAAIEAGLRGAIPANGAAHGDPDPYDAGHEYYAQHDQYSQHGQYARHDEYAAEERDAGEDQDHGGQRWPEAGPREAPPASHARRPIYAMIATIAVGVIGVGLAFAFKGSSSSPGEIKTIVAASGPNKVQPPVDAAADQGNQDASMASNGGQQTPTRLVNGEEQPVDISQAVQANASRNADVGQGDASSVPIPAVPGQASSGQASPGQASPGQASPGQVSPGQVSAADNLPPIAPSPSKDSTDQTSSFGLSGMPTPKKVKVVSVRPDGTILSNDRPPSAAVSDPIAALSAAPEPHDAPTPSSPKTSTPKSTSRVATTPKSAQLAKADDAGDASPPKPARKAKPKRVAAVEPAAATTNTASPPADADASKATGGLATGGFAVQLAAPGSEAEAQTASTRLAKKFADALDGRRLGVHKAQSNGKSVFRVRVGSLSKEDAVSLCEKLKANGGSCFVAKN